MTGAISQFTVMAHLRHQEHTVKFYIYDDVQKLREDAQRFDGQNDGVKVKGVCHGIGYHIGEAPRRLAVIRLCTEYLTHDIVAHEVSHAAAHIYGTLLGDHARAINHMTGGNEVHAHLLGELHGKTVRELFLRGFSVTMKRTARAKMVYSR
jgi:hypothetical protein